MITYTSPLINGLSRIRNHKDLWGFSDGKKIIIPPKYQEVSNFYEDLAVIKVNNLYGFINKSGEIVIEPQYLDVHNFINGVALVKTFSGYTKWQKINTKNEIITYRKRKIKIHKDKVPAKTGRKFKFSPEVEQSIIEQILKGVRASKVARNLIKNLSKENYESLKNCKIIPQDILRIQKRHNLLRKDLKKRLDNKQQNS